VVQVMIGMGNGFTVLVTAGISKDLATVHMIIYIKDLVVYHFG